jgi:hypothetical protein
MQEGNIKGSGKKAKHHGKKSTCHCSRKIGANGKAVQDPLMRMKVAASSVLFLLTSSSNKASYKK